MTAILAALSLLVPLTTAPGAHLLIEADTPAVAGAPAVRMDPPNPPSVEQIIRDVFPDNLEERALRIAWRESRWQPDVRTWCCFGVMQIHKMHLAWLCPQLGICTTGDLYDPRLNAEAALALYQRDGWSPWSLS